MQINIICIGKLKEKYWTAAIEEYLKRLSSYCNIKVVELNEVRLPKNASFSDEENVINREGESILARIGDRDYVFALEIEGKLISSKELAESLEGISFEHSTIDFIIGGSLGLSEAVKKRADRGISFGRITLPHQLARVVLAEQVYRAFKIINNEAYHK